MIRNNDNDNDNDKDNGNGNGNGNSLINNFYRRCPIFLAIAKLIISFRQCMKAICILLYFLPK